MCCDGSVVGGGCGFVVLMGVDFVGGYCGGVVVGLIWFDGVDVV